MGRGSTTPDVKITPNRKLHIEYDPNDVTLLNRGWGLVRTAEDLAKGAKLAMCTLVPGIGIRLDEDFASSRASHIYTNSDRGVFERVDELGVDGVEATIASGFTKRMIFRSRTEVDGSDTDSTLPLVAGVMYRKKLIAGTDSGYSNASFRLSADETAFEGPGLYDTNAVKMDRVLVSKDNHDYERNLMFTFVVYGDTGQKGIAVGTAYFNGPAGLTKNFCGKGQYAVIVYNSGVLDVWERGNPITYTDGLATVGDDTTTTWELRQSIKTVYADTGAWTANMAYCLNVKIITSAQAGATYPFGAIVLTLMAGTQNRHSAPGTGIKRLGDSAIFWLGSLVENIFAVPYTFIPFVTATTKEEKVRVDLPRPFKTQFQVKQVFNYTEGQVIDFPLAVTQGDFAPWLDGVTLRGHTLRLEWYFTQPGGVAGGTNVLLGIRPINSDTDLIPIRSGYLSSDNSAGKWAEYDFAEDYTGTASFNATFDLSGTTQKGPTLMELRAFKVPILGVAEVETVSGGVIQSFSTIGGGSDYSTESAGWKVTDDLRELDRLQYNASMRVVVESEYDAADSDLRMRYFAGFVESAQVERWPKRGKQGRLQGGPDYPIQIINEYTIKAVGEWLRIKETRDTTLFSFAQDPNAPQGVPYRITDILKTVLKRCGYSEDNDRVKIPDNEIRLFPVLSMGSDKYWIKPLSPLDNALDYFARDYLGASLSFDANYGDLGAWILIYPPTAPYTNVAYFTTAAQPSGKVFSLDAFADLEITEGDFGGVPHLESTAKTIPIIAYKAEPKPPVANVLNVAGLGILITNPFCVPIKRLINQNSFKFRGDAPCVPGEDNPDWLGRERPFWYIDPMLQTPEALELVAAQLYRILCVGYKMIRIYAPLQGITQMYDLDGDGEAETAKKRPLRFGDPVVVFDGENTLQCVVRSVSLDIQSDFQQMAVYELQQVRS